MPFFFSSETRKSSRSSCCASKERVSSLLPSVMPVGRPLVDEVQANDVDAVTRQRARPHRSVFLGRKFDRAGTPVGEMHAPEADALAVGLHEVTALNANEAILPGGAVVQERNVGRRSSGGAMIDDERLEKAVVPLRLREGREREECGDKRGPEPIGHLAPILLRIQPERNPPKVGWRKRFVAREEGI